MLLLESSFLGNQLESRKEVESQLEALDLAGSHSDSGRCSTHWHAATLVAKRKKSHPQAALSKDSHVRHLTIPYYVLLHRIVSHSFSQASRTPVGSTEQMIVFTREP